LPDQFHDHQVGVRELLNGLLGQCDLPKSLLR
jgi:hypothetical protein